MRSATGPRSSTPRWTPIHYLYRSISPDELVALYRAADAMLVPDTAKMAVNYGLDRVRFLAPVKAGKRVRGHFTLDSAEEKAPGQLLLNHTVTVEIEGEERPALTAQWLGLIFT